MPTLLTNIDLNQSELENLCIKPFTYTGSVESVRDLPRDPNIGEFRYASNTGTMYVWTGECWDGFYETIQPGYIPKLGDTPFPDGPKQKEYSDLTCEHGLYNIIRGWFNYHFMRLQWNLQLG